MSHAELDTDVGGIAHTTLQIGSEHPDYVWLRSLAVPETAGDRRQIELDQYLAQHRPEGDAMLRLLQRQTGKRHRWAR
ncbi:hypothetical protein ETD83_29725 [Actinomadura soli]|uniref:Uncharacterized protein n=1 Tax=Actinomadura soli TaxID=2508997 RepID=A0A5C4J592_9ACTN|nr:hypothetical protein [Actinomadura soli]TMQ91683.1 hypothetical protein ETD83_29725 [Actinomadura soli]